MSKIYETCIGNSLSSYTETILSNFILAYKKSYSSNHVLSRPIENWKKSRDNKNLVTLPKILTVFLMIYLLENFMHMVYQSMQ